jgi:membrane protease YdiL (CAAX protease family)
MTSVKSFLKKHAVLSYFALTIAITWGTMIAVLGPGGLPITTEQFEALAPLVYGAMLVGPGTTAILLTGLVDGKAGFRALWSRLSTWRVGIRWYVLALLSAPLIALVVLFALSLSSPEFIPALFTADDKAGLLISGIVAGLMVGFFEELGWTGFAAPRMRNRYDILSTGLIIGLVWGAWHFLPFWEADTFSGTLPFALLIGRLFAWLPAYRILMVWVYYRTESLLVVVLMHASLVATTLTLPSMELTGMPLLTWLLTWSVGLWLTVGAITIVSNRKSAQPDIQHFDIPRNLSTK